jgi:hypothetical protein
MKFFFRKPVFPILVDTGTELIVMRRAGEGDRLARLVEPGAKPLDIIDSRVEGFAYHPRHDIISPLTLKKDWKKEKSGDHRAVQRPQARRRSGVRAQPGKPQARAGVRGRS